MQELFAASSGSGIGAKLTEKLPVSVLYLTNLVYSAAVLVNLLGCLWYWTARREGIDSEHIWLRSVGTDRWLPGSAACR